MKTADERRAHGRLICRRVTARIGAVVSKEAGRWDPAWEAVEGPSGEFLDALDAWIAQDSPEGRERVQAAAEALVQAWKQAGALFAAVREGALERSTDERRLVSPPREGVGRPPSPVVEIHPDLTGGIRTIRTTPPGDTQEGGSANTANTSRSPKNFGSPPGGVATSRV